VAQLLLIVTFRKWFVTPGGVTFAAGDSGVALTPVVMVAEE
jgi:hypothetical protein